MTEKLYKTGEILKKTDCPRQTFYQYVNAGLIEAAGRTPGGHSLYDESALKKVTLIRQLNDKGYTLQAIREIFFRKDRGE